MKGLVIPEPLFCVPEHINKENKVRREWLMFHEVKGLVHIKY